MIDALILGIVLACGGVLGSAITEWVNRAHDEQARTPDAEQAAMIAHDVLYEFDRAAGIPEHDDPLFDEKRTIALIKDLTGVELESVPVWDLLSDREQVTP